MRNDKVTNRSNRLLLFMIIMFAVVSPAIIHVNADAASKDTVRIGCFPLNGYCEFALNGHVSGYGIEYADTICNLAGYDVKHVRYDSWVAALDGLGKGEIDMLGPAEKTPEREEKFDFVSFQAGIEYGSILALNTANDLIYEDFEGFRGLKVGCVRSLIFYDDFIEYEEANDFKVELVFYDDTPALVDALSKGEVRAIVANLMVKNDSMKTLARFGAASYYFMTTKTKKGLVDKLDAAMEKQNTQFPEYQKNLQYKYFESVSIIPFTKSELDYISGGEVIKVAMKSNYKPFAYVDGSGTVTGVDPAILNRISRISGLKFEYIPLPEGMDPIEFIQTNDIPLIIGLETGESGMRIKGVSLSDSAYEISKSFIGPQNTDFSISTNMSVAVVNMTDEQIRYWKLKYPAFSFHEYDSENACIDAIRKGKADIVLSNRYSIENILNKPWNSDLAFIPTVATTAQICMGVNNTYENGNELIDILNKSISMITEEDIETYLSTYAQSTRYQYDFNDFIYVYRVQIIALVCMLLIIIICVVLFIHGRRKVQKEIARNLSRQLELTERLGIENKRIELILDKVEEVFFEVLSSGKVSVSPSFQDKFGWKCPDRIKINDAIAEQLLRIVPEDRAIATQAVDKLINSKQPVNCTVRLELADNETSIWCEVSCYPILSEKNKLVSAIGLIKDINDIILERERLKERTLRDPMTGLLNKEAFELQVMEAIHRQPGGNHALLFVDLDHFKSVNDILGHLMGDKAICDAAEKLQLVFSHYDIISRFGGDEFCIFVKDIPIETLKSKLEWMLDKLQADYTDNGRSVHITCSCGVACTEKVGRKYKKLVECADQALYASKENGRNRYTFYSGLTGIGRSGT